ncbi:MAG: hypothetical protein ACLQVI_33435 [Polyangiaceae bacterium]
MTSSSSPGTNGAPSGAVAEAGDDVRIESLGKGIGVRLQESEPRGWFTKLARWYLARRFAKHGHGETTSGPLDASASDRAQRAITIACVKSAISGALSGSVSTGATVVTAQTEGALAFAAIPVAVGAIGGEMLYRSLLHLDLTCDLAEIFGLSYDPSHEEDLWRLYALAFGTADHEEAGEGEGDQGKELVREVTHVESEEVGEKIGHLVLGESIMRNVVPVVGILSSAITNVVLTRRMGHTVRRYFRYQRAFNDTFAHAIQLLDGEPRDLLIEGMWFIFTADGKLSPEEAACLGKLVHKLDPVERHAVTHRFVEDELDWTERIGKGVPEELKDVFLHALEVAAAVDKEVGVPERKILRRAARVLGREWDPARVEKMMADFEERGVLSTGAKGGKVAKVGRSAAP